MSCRVVPKFDIATGSGEVHGDRYQIKFWGDELPMD
jgi:hypothetical protein